MNVINMVSMSSPSSPAPVLDGGRISRYPGGVFHKMILRRWNRAMTVPVLVPLLMISYAQVSQKMTRIKPLPNTNLGRIESQNPFVFLSVGTSESSMSALTMSPVIRNSFYVTWYITFPTIPKILFESTDLLPVRVYLQR